MSSDDRAEEPQLDGGFRAWSVAFGAWCCLFTAFGWINCKCFHSLIQSDMSLMYCSDWYLPRLLSVSPIARLFVVCNIMDLVHGDLHPFRCWIVSRQSLWLIPKLVYHQLTVRQLFDNFGPRWLLCTGTCLHVFGLLMLSVSKTYYQILLSQGICSSLGTGFIFYPALLSTATWFRTRKALAFGLVTSGSSLGGIVFTTILSSTLPQLGFAWSIRICAFVVIGMLVIANLTVQSRTKPKPKPANFKAYTTPFTEYPFVILTIASSLGFLALFVPSNYMTLQAQSNNVASSISLYLLTIFNAASLLGRILPGYLADKFGCNNIMLSFCALATLSILALWLPGTLIAPGSAAVYIAFSIVYGFSSGAFVGLVPPMLTQISKENPSDAGLRQGVLFTCLAIASLCGNPIGGAILENMDGRFWGLQVFSGAAMAGATVFFALGYRYFID